MPRLKSPFFFFFLIVSSLKKEGKIQWQRHIYLDGEKASMSETISTARRLMELVKIR